MEYSKAPVSAVILGITFGNNNKMPVDKLFQISSMFSEEFPIVEICPPVVLEELNGFRLQPMVADIGAGPFLVRRRTSDAKWLLQIQSNKIYLNWIRKDDEPVGVYAGFSSVKEYFASILKKISEVVDMNTDHLLYELSYQDRVEWQDIISDISEINTIMNVKAPPKFSAEGYNNLFSRYTYPASDIGGYGLLGINTDTSVSQKQVIRFESNLRGIIPQKTFDEWTAFAHQKQLAIFESCFSEKLRNLWK
ncbi:MAG: TIGR04255 family protein [Spirochaetaceae bacterium]|jgi:uncharacterized protein (TIGR04255 family)|nr:TIGR04255 family protein [Spirochaetaceae bacterium]